MPGTRGSYNLEETLVEDLCAHLETGETEWGEVRLGREFYYLSGRIDVIAVNTAKDLYAFEAKLRNWREALNQAYRNTSFTTKSYVVMPQEEAESTQKHAYEFERRCVGLCAVEPDGVHVLIPARRNQAIQEWLKESAIASTGE